MCKHFIITAVRLCASLRRFIRMQDSPDAQSCYENVSNASNAIHPYYGDLATVYRYREWARETHVRSVNSSRLALIVHSF